MHYCKIIILHIKIFYKTLIWKDPFLDLILRVFVVIILKFKKSYKNSDNRLN